MLKNRILFSLCLLIILGCPDRDWDRPGDENAPLDCSTEVTLWGVVYSIEETNVLNLDHVQLNDTIPPEIGCLTNLTSLNLQATQLTGEIPSEIGNLTNLVNLSLPYNGLTGEIPPEIADLTGLTVLDLTSNQLTSAVPSGIENLQALER